MTGRNEKCPCGSGGKYKHCHLKYERLNAKEIASEIDFEHPHKDVINKTYFAIIEDFQRFPNPGACHLLSSIAFLLLSEQNVEVDLCIGEVEHSEKRFIFDHSWIEINNKPFDISIQLSHDKQNHSPIYAGYDLDTGIPSKFNYRFEGVGLDSTAWRVNNIEFVKYMDGASDIKGWGAVERIGTKFGLNLDKNELRERYKGTERKKIVTAS